MRVKYWFPIDGSRMDAANLHVPIISFCLADSARLLHDFAFMAKGYPGKINKRHFTETDIRTKFITPALISSNWDLMTQITT